MRPREQREKEIVAIIPHRKGWCSGAAAAATVTVVRVEEKENGGWAGLAGCPNGVQENNHWARRRRSERRPLITYAAVIHGLNLSLFDSESGFLSVINASTRKCDHMFTILVRSLCLFILSWYSGCLVLALSRCRDDVGRKDKTENKRGLRS